MYDEILHIRRRHFRLGLHKTMNQAGTQCQNSRVLGEVLSHGKTKSPSACQLIESHRVLQPPVHTGGKVIDVIFPYTIKTVLEWDASLVEYIRSPDSRQLQDLRRLNGSGTQNDILSGTESDLATALTVSDTSAT
ncbi:hypothetical protein D3C81_1375830 [compost metagenome]